MTAWSFAVLALATLVSGALVVTRRNPVAAVAWLVAHFVATAGVYLVLDSQFVAAVQVLVYAGAILVLFLFVVMLLAAEGLPDAGVSAGTGRVVLVLALVAALVSLFARLVGAPGVPGAGPAAAPPSPDAGTAAGLARALFSGHLVAFELASLPLLAAMAGVLVYATRRVPARRGGEEAAE